MADKTANPWVDVYCNLPRPPSDYPPLEDRPHPERFTNDIFRDSLPELEFRLEEAAVKGDTQAVHELISLGADKDAALDKDHKTALMIACQLGWFYLVKWLVEMEGVDVDGPLSRAGLRAIDYAGMEHFKWPNEEMEIVEYLKSKGSNHTWWGACCSGDIARIDEYLENGQDVGEVNPVLWNNNGVECALFGGHAKAAQFLIARGGLVAIRNCHIPFNDEMFYSTGRGDAFMYKEMGLEEGKAQRI